MNRATASPTGDAGLSVSGRVLDEQSQPIPGATVYVYSAGVREGTSPYCPTCYVDCGKRAVTLADGRFEIIGLDPTLVFRLLAVAERYRPIFIPNVDPRDDADVEVKLGARPLPDDARRVVRGRVIDPSGRPAVGAVVETFGCQTDEKRWWGAVDGADPLAVTNARGDFILVCDAPVVGLDLRVESRGAARKNFPLVKSANRNNRLQLETGVAVTGRVVANGQPVSGVLVGVCQANRQTGTFVGAYQVGTNDEGRFTFANLPSGGALLVYGIMTSLGDVGALPAKSFMPVGNAVTDLGELSPMPASRLRGRVALADQKPVPPHTRVLISRADAWDSTMVEAAEGGTFSVDGLPPEVVQVTVQVSGYRLSAKNKSFEPLNGLSLRGKVSGDIEDLTILLEPGNWLPPRNSAEASAKHLRLNSQVLAGVTAALEEFPPESGVEP